MQKRPLTFIALLGSTLSFCFVAPVFAQGKQEGAESAQATRQIVASQRSVLTMIASLWEGDKDSIKIKLSPNRYVYHFGEVMKLRVMTDKDAYVVLLDQGASGRTHWLVPNRWHPNELHLKANAPITIPDNAKWTFDVGGPRGVDVIYALASSTPVSREQMKRLRAEIESGQDFPEIKRPTRAAFRDVFVRKGKVQRGTANIKINVIP
jgi:hypothetical protein